MAEKFKPRKPDYTLSAMDKKSGTKGPIGAAWKNEDGTLTVKINPFVVLNTVDMQLVVMLYPVIGENTTTTTTSKRKVLSGGDGTIEDSDTGEISF